MKIATATVDIEFNTRSLSTSLNKLSRDINTVFNRITAVGSGIALKALHSFLKSNSDAAIDFRAKLDQLNAAFARLGEKIASVKIFGKTITEWIDILITKIDSITTTQLQNMLNLWIKIALVVKSLTTAIYALKFSQDFIKVLEKFGVLSVGKQISTNIGSGATSAAGGVLGGAIGAGGAIGGIKAATALFGKFSLIEWMFKPLTDKKTWEPVINGFKLAFYGVVGIIKGQAGWVVKQIISELLKSLGTVLTTVISPIIAGFTAFKIGRWIKSYLPYNEVSKTKERDRLNQYVDYINEKKEIREEKFRINNIQQLSSFKKSSKSISDFIKNIDEQIANLIQENEVRIPEKYMVQIKGTDKYSIIIAKINDQIARVIEEQSLLRIKAIKDKVDVTEGEYGIINNELQKRQNELESQREKAVNERTSFINQEYSTLKQKESTTTSYSEAVNRMYEIMDNFNDKIKKLKKRREEIVKSKIQDYSISGGTTGSEELRNRVQEQIFKNIEDTRRREQEKIERDKELKNIDEEIRDATKDNAAETIRQTTIIDAIRTVILSWNNPAQEVY